MLCTLTDNGKLANQIATLLPIVVKMKFQLPRRALDLHPFTLISTFFFNLMSCRISKRKDEVLKRRQNVKQLAAKRRQALKQSQLLQNFKRDTQEVTPLTFYLSRRLFHRSPRLNFVFCIINTLPMFSIECSLTELPSTCLQVRATHNK